MRRSDILRNSFNEFETWVDRVLPGDGLPQIVAFNFNLYEHEDEFAIQLVGSDYFDKDNSDWPCDAIFTTGEDLFLLPHSLIGPRWLLGLRAAKVLVERYLESGKHSVRLKSSAAVSVGFVSGDLEYVYLS